MLFGERECLFQVEVAHDQRHGIIGRVVGAEEFLHVFESGGVEIEKSP